MSLSLSVLSQSGPPKSVGGGGGRGGVVYHTSTGQYIGVATFFFFFFILSGLKLDEKSIENGLEGQKFLVVCLFWGGCHHPNSMSVSVLMIIFNQLSVPFSVITLYKLKLDTQQSKN